MYGFASAECVLVEPKLMKSKLENAPITAIPLNVEAASRVGGVLASPISWVKYKATIGSETR